jgi:hypothetical protein
MEHVTFQEYFKKYVVSKTPNSRLGEVLGYDTFGHHVQGRPPDQPVRFSDPHPSSNPEGFFYNILLREVCFRDERELLSTENGPQSYYTECCLRGIIKSEDDLVVSRSYVTMLRLHGYGLYLIAVRLGGMPDAQAEVTKYCQDNMYNETSQTHILEKLLETHDPSQPVGAGAAPAVVQEDEEEEDLSEELADSEQLHPNAEQARVKAALLEGATGLVVVSGGPGTGKTFLTRHLIHLWRKAGRSLVVAATTGAAATRISKGARTVHSAFRIPLNGMYLGGLKSYNPKFQRLKKAEIIIIDEMSMLSSITFGLLLFRLQQCGGFRDVATMLKHKLIVLVGDHAQVSFAWCVVSCLNLGAYEHVGYACVVHMCVLAVAACVSPP